MTTANDRKTYNDFRVHDDRLRALKAGLVVSTTRENPLLATDVYKMGHMEQYAPGTEFVYSYLVARSNKHFERSVFFGLQYYLQEFLSKRLEPWMGEEFLIARRQILGSNSSEVEEKIRALCQLGYFPILIKAVPEGSVVPVRNVLMTITNTVPGYGWVVGFLESLIIKVWYPTTTASCSYQYRNLVERMFKETVDDENHFLKDFMIHDFGYRGDGSEDSAAITGAAHLISSQGSDNVPALPFIFRHYYGSESKEPIMMSVPASEHSVMCSFGRNDEIGAFRHMLKTYPTGIVSIVSDTFDVYTFLTDFAEQLKEIILNRDGKTVFRPDSGDPEHIICGDPMAPADSLERKGVVRLLDEKFGSTVNKKGYKVLNDKVGLIYGDGMYYERYKRTLHRLQDMGYATSNLVIGVGGILRNYSRDTLGFAIKATYVLVNGEHRDIEKDPITDPGKKSHKGLMVLERDADGNYVTYDQVDREREQQGLLVPVFRNGRLLREYTWEEVRANLREG